MSDVVNTAADSFGRGRNHCGGIGVSPCEPSVATPEVSHGERQESLSLAAPRTRHGPVGGRHLHHRSARPQATVDQLRLGCTCRAVSGLTRHGGLGQEDRPAVLDGDFLMVVNNIFGPNSGGLLGSHRGLRRGGRANRRARGGARPRPPGRGLRPAVRHPPPRQNHHRQVISAAPSRAFRLYGLDSGRCGTTRTSSPLPVAQHWRSSNAMSRTNQTPMPRLYLPVAEARGLSGEFR
jgi:hypothetical protein